MSKLSRMLSVFGLCLAGIQAQAQRPGTILPVDSPDLHESFFYVHNDLSNFVEQKSAAEPAAAQRLEQGSATVLGVNRADLPQVRAISKQVVADLKKIDDDRRDHLNRRAKLELGGDPALLKDFALRRQQTVAAGIDKLNKTLPPASWNGLHTFINERHRQSVRVIDTGKK